MPNWIVRILRARDAAEARSALLAAALFFSVICGYLVVKPVRDALFLHKRGFVALPLFYLITAGVIFVLGLVVNVVSDRWPRRPLLVGGFATFGLVFLGFRAWLAADLPFGAEAFMVWVSVFNLLAVYLFWALANDVFTPEQAGRLYGPIGTGGVLGSIAGSALASLLVASLGTRNLILVGAVFQAVSLALGFQLGGQPAGAPHPARPHGLAAGLDGLRTIARSDYLQQIVGIVVLVTFVGTFFDYQFKEIVARELRGEDAKTAFFSHYGLAQNLLAFVLQFGLVAFLQTRWGPAPGLLALVGFQGLCAAVLGLSAVLGQAVALGPAVALTLPVGALFYSTHQSAKELLYTPLGAEEKYQAKVFADTFAFRLGDAFTAALLLVGQGLVSPGVYVLGALPFILLRCLVSVRAARRYSELVAAPASGPAAAAGSGAEFKVSQ